MGGGGGKTESKPKKKKEKKEKKKKRDKKDKKVRCVCLAGSEGLFFLRELFYIFAFLIMFSSRHGCDTTKHEVGARWGWREDARLPRFESFFCFVVMIETRLDRV